MDNIIRDKIIKLLIDGNDIPYELQSCLFPIKQKEYELIYADKSRKEDILAVSQEPQSVPFQIEKTFFESTKSKWNNLLIFGDNFQVLKTMYENKDPLIKNKIKSKVKLIYIDPPFATESDFNSKNGEKAYSDKIRGAEFVEFLRKKLIIARELLDKDGSIFVHLDGKKSHYIKVLMDEIFSENNFVNEIFWQSSSSGKTLSRNLAKDVQTILWYSKSENYKFFKVFSDLSEKTKQMYRHDDKDGRGKYRYYPLQKTDGPTKGTGYDYVDESGKVWECPKKGWRMVSEKLKALELDNRLSVNTKTLQEKAYWNERENEGKVSNNLWNDIPNLQGNNKEITGYPTQKPENLLKRIIEMTTVENDLILDFFAGSGTTLIVAEKLNRRWIGCDLGKYSIYTIQKRLLTMPTPPSSFSLINAGIYDLTNVFTLKKLEYENFVLDLFHIERQESSINGIKVDGKRRGSWVKIFSYQDFKDNVAINVGYIKDLHNQIGDNIGERFYLIAPQVNIDIVGEYYKVENTRYYFLRIPYQVINELHNLKFKKLKQPRTLAKVNDIEDSVGFQFNDAPEVDSCFEKTAKDCILTLKSISSDYLEIDELSNIVKEDILAMILIDTGYNGTFVMKRTIFADELAADECGHRKIVISKKDITNDKIMIIYIDIYGNEFREIVEVN